MILILDLNGLDGRFNLFLGNYKRTQQKHDNSFRMRIFPSKDKSFTRVFCDSMYQKEKRKHLFKHLFYQTFVRNQITNTNLNAFNYI